MHPPLLDESGLLAALHVFFEGFEKRSKLRITFEYKPDTFPRLSTEIETSVFRVVQEALTNVHRHSRSDDARVEVHQQADRVYVRVRDFGVGMPSSGPMSAPIQNMGVGVTGMRERIKQIGGEVNILPAEPGTLVEAIIPLFQ
jgi:signal transduction histidine kinase